MQLAEPWVILHQVADHQPPVRALRESTKPLGLGQGQRKWLLDKDMFARLYCATRQLGMQRRRCRDRYTGDVGIAQHRLEFTDRRAITIGELLRRGTVGITDRREGAKLGKITNQVLAPIAAANGSHPYTGSRFLDSGSRHCHCPTQCPHATAVPVTKRHVSGLQQDQYRGSLAIRWLKLLLPPPLGAGSHYPVRAHSCRGRERSPEHRSVGPIAPDR